MIKCWWFLEKNIIESLMNKLDNLVFDLFSYSECLKIKLNIVILINVCYRYKYFSCLIR